MDFGQLNQEILSITAQVQQIPAPTGQEQERANFVFSLFSKIGLENVHIDRAGNVLGFFKGGGLKPVIISAHLDTVHNLDAPLPLNIDGKRLTGPGIGDNSLAVASLIGLARYMMETKTSLPGGIWFVGNVGEEGLGNLSGMIEIVRKFGEDAIAYLVVEGIGLGQIYHRGLGVKRYRISFNTPGGHSWSNYGTPSAIHELARLVTGITEIQIPLHPRSSLNVGTIIGGTTVNSIASHASFDLDIRSESQEMLLDLSNKVLTLTDTLTTDNVQSRIQTIGDRPSGSLPDNHPLVMFAINTLKNLGCTADIGIASTDSNVPLSKGFPSICIGLTRGGKSHTLDEYIETEPLSTGLEQLHQIATKIWDYL